MKYIISLLLFPVALLACSEDKDEVETKNLVFETSEITVNVGEKETIKIIEAPSNSESVVWTSDNETVATVFFGEVTAKASGKATITATMGEYVAECIVTVPEREYKLVWADEFEGTELNSDNWSIEVNGNGGGNNEAQYYTDRYENLRVENGMLVIEARKEDYEGKSYTSARIVSKNKKDFTYGKVEAKLKVPSGRGTWPAFWMLGYGSWPSAGEIDIMEYVGYDPNTFHCALHTANKNGMNGQNFKGSQTFDSSVADDFHVITMEWVENEIMGYDRIRIFIDGVESKTFGETAQLQDSGDWPFNKPFFFIINLAIGGNWGGIEGIDDDIFDDSVLYEIDYVRVYQLQ